MKQTIPYFILSVLFVLVIVACHQLVAVYLLDHYDPKFGAFGTLTIALFLSGMCAAVSALAASVSFAIARRWRGERPPLREITYRSMINGLMVAICYMPIFHHAPIVSGFKDWPQYLFYFLLLGVVMSSISGFIFHRIDQRRHQES